MAARDVIEPGFARFSPGLVAAKVDAPAAHRHAGADVGGPRLKRAGMEDEAVDAVEPGVVAAGFEGGGGFGPGAVFGGASEGLGFNDVVAGAVGAAESVEGCVVGGVEGARLVGGEPEFGHEAIDGGRDFGRVEGACVGFVREGEAFGAAAGGHTFEEDVAIEVAEGAVEVSGEVCAFGGGVEVCVAAEDGQEIEAVIAAAVFKFGTEVRRPGRGASFVAVEENVVETRGGEVLAEVLVEFVEEVVEVEVDGFGIHLIAFETKVGPVGRLDESAHRDVTNGDAADGGDGLVARATGFTGGEFEGFVVFVVDGEDGVRRR